MATTVMVAAVRVSTVSRPHQVSTGYCAASSSAMMVRMACISEAKRA